MMLGLMLTRAGIEAAVLEKHKDFLRDFRGDTIHPSTLELMYELAFQVFAHKRLLTPALSRQTPIRRLPLLLKILQWFPVLRRIPARMVGIGVRPEHVKSPAIKAATNL